MFQDSAATSLQWLAQLTIPQDDSVTSGVGSDTKYLRKTSIICTIGPKTNHADKIQELRAAGMNIVRMNFSHGSYDYHKSVIDNARKAELDHPGGRPLAIALDTKGPEIRTGLMKDDKDIPIKVGHELTITSDDSYAEKCDDKVMYIDYKNLCKMIAPGKIIYVDDGILSFTVVSVDEANGTLKAKAINNGTLSSRKGVNLPKTDVDLPALSDKDKKDLRFGVENNVDMIFASFIRTAQDVRAIREVLGEDGKTIKVIVKIENHQGVFNFDEILRECDGVMVARGDLGIEIPASQVFIAQKMMIAKCNLAGKPCICATQMLESMTYNPRPTRAEVSDVANAVLDGADCVMLSGETAKGTYPIEAVQMMHETCYLAETAVSYPVLFNELRQLAPRPTETTETVASSAVSAAIEQRAGAIIVLSYSGTTARLVSKYRPPVPILMVTRNPQTARQSHLSRGVYPLFFQGEKPTDLTEWQQDVDRRISFAVQEALKMRLIDQKTTIVVIQGWKSGLGNTNTLRLVTCEALESAVKE